MASQNYLQYIRLKKLSFEFTVLSTKKAVLDQKLYVDFSPKCVLRLAPLKKTAAERSLKNSVIVIEMSTFKKFTVN